MTMTDVGLNCSLLWW